MGVKNRTYGWGILAILLHPFAQLYYYFTYRNKLYEFEKKFLIGAIVLSFAVFIIDTGYMVKKINKDIQKQYIEKNHIQKM